MSPQLNGVAVFTLECPAAGLVSDARTATTTTNWVTVLVTPLLSVTVSDTV